MTRIASVSLVERHCCQDDGEGGCPRPPAHVQEVAVEYRKEIPPFARPLKAGEVGTTTVREEYGVRDGPFRAAGATQATKVAPAEATGG
jgi:hypothetical protein